ncbi:hypothetical protein SAY86_018721 [Trapa natans]|uniref:Thg1 C-terminal domain-containing protein n=1 Tax=Trapa natans TaxID=22666 RepID=A0AAN7R3E3_TRANT|nr:hypothetical protein SAY86_018721 [Trapa natans]
MLVKSGKTKDEAQKSLKGIQSQENCELLPQHFSIDYSSLSVMFRQGSSVCRVKIFVPRMQARRHQYQRHKLQIIPMNNKRKIKLIEVNASNGRLHLQKWISPLDKPSPISPPDRDTGLHEQARESNGSVVAVTEWAE